MDHLSGIGLFVKAADAGSFAAAAKSLGVTPSAVSKAVSRLENRLGVQLFRRSTRSIELTDDGRAFFDRAKTGLLEIEAAEAFLLEKRAEPRGVLRVSAPVVFSHRILAPLLSDFSMKFQNLDVELHATDGFSDLIEDGFDVLIRTGALTDSALIARKLIDTRFVTAAAPQYLEAAGVPKSIEELKNHRCLRYVFPSSRRHFSWPLASGSEKVAYDPGTALSFTNADAMIAAAEAGAGIVHLQDYILEKSISQGRLTPILSASSIDGGPVSAVYLATRHLSPNVRSFVDFLYASTSSRRR